MRPISLFSTAVILLLLPSAGSAQTVDECRIRCAAEKDTNNTTCPAAMDYSGSSQERDQCLRRNQETYTECIRACPPLPSTPAPEGQQILPPAPMGY